LLDDRCAVLVEPDDVSALAAALVAAARLPRVAARAHATAHCSQDQMIEQYEDLYRELAA
jgi:glycosyltransferase involved in cell wall biosynthesis